MDPFECYTFKEAIDHKTCFTRSQPQGYYRFINNLKMVGNLLYNYNLELNRGPRQIAQISEPPQGGKSSLDFVVRRSAEEAKLRDKTKS